ncbi:AmmeMemoRadiSam system protein A [Collinsella sp. An2]|uniref:AmmeMemoRadiSam system protein A n=1 Tax=Collinsella sp. An2 TaxID=1965585 RepID=UPI000B38C45A|nr:AmmeMemoRadiSam system protein A [Collinsella sp. An2]OUP08873.1 AmmeMemoRadiSam system protein A [Collinsella sp. An2]
MSIVASFAVPHPPLIIPAVGHGREQGISHTIDAYREVGRHIAALKPDTIVISSPHTEMYLDYIHIAGGAQASGTFARFGAAHDGTRVRYDEEFVQELCRVARAAGLPAGTQGERDPQLDWGVLVPLHFVMQGYRETGTTIERTAGLPTLPCPVVRMGLSGLSPADHYRMGKLVQQTAEELGRDVVYIASGDLSHKLKDDGPYGYSPDGPVFDELICNVFRDGSFLDLLTADPGMCERAAECGLRSFQIMAGALDRTPVRSELLSHEGPFGVGYGIAAFIPTGPAGSDESRAFEDQYETWHAQDLQIRRSAEDHWVRLARYSLESYVRGGRRVDPRRDLTPELADTLPPELFRKQAGAFVSLKKNGQLRGCIGTILPTRDSLAEEICANAISAGCRDPRFDPVEPSELDELVYDVDVLSTPERISSANDLDPRRYGVIVSTSDGRRGLLLPDLDGIDTAEEQIHIAARKGRIDPDADDVQLERFTVTRHL